jgi:hypothetical protein
MEPTQAQAPGQPQAQQPAQPQHRIIEEQSVVDRLTKYVSETPDNDPHQGTDMEEPTDPPEEKAEPEVKAEEKPEDTVDLSEDDPIFDIEYKTDSGKEQKKLSLKELREGYLAKQDYHRNIQKVQKERSEIAEQAKQAELKAVQEYAQRLEAHKQAVTKLAGVKSIQEIEALSRQDPAAAQQEFLKLISVNQTVQQIEAEQRNAIAKAQSEQSAARDRAIEKSRQTLQQDIPGWGEELYGKVLSSMVSDFGLKKEGVANVAEAELIKVFHDAYQFRQLQKAKPEISKKVVAVPKVLKPGSADKTNPASTAVQEAEKGFRKSGDWRDAAKLYLARQKQQKR